MERYIDAEKLSVNLLKQWKTADKEKSENISSIISSVVVPIVADTPTEDVAPIKHAYWDDRINKEMPYCSSCGTAHGCLYRPNYCPHCGAKMDEVIR